MAGNLSHHWKAKVALNSATDPSVIFNIGNAIYSWPSSRLAASINLSMAAFCALVRCTSELRNMGINPPLPGPVSRFVENRGAALVTDGAFTGISGATHFITNPIEGLTKAFMLTSFGLSKICRGVATGMKKGSLRQKFTDMAAFPVGFIGTSLGMSEAPWEIKIPALGLIALIGAYTFLRHGRSKGPLQPDLMSTAAYTSYAALFAQRPEEVVAFCIWATGYLSLDLLKKTGGVWETAQRLGDRLRKLEKHFGPDYTKPGLH